MPILTIMLGISKSSARLLTVAAASIAAIAFARNALRRRHRIDLRGRVAVVTGGSRGLGLLLAEELGERGARVAICGRNAEAVAQAANRLGGLGIEVHAEACDLGDRAAAEDFIDRVVRTFGRIDVLVNNAGIIQVAPIEDLGVAGVEEAMNSNFWSAAHVTLRALPHLKMRGRSARIVNVVSIGGRVALPHLLGYTASKFAMMGWSEGLREELAGAGVLVTTVIPGPMRTGSIYNAEFGGDANREFAWFGALSSLPILTIGARRAARRIVRAALDGRAEVRLGLSAHALSLAHGVMPSLVTRALGFVAKSILPRATGRPDLQHGRELRSRLQRSVLLRLSNRAARANNESPPAEAR